MNALIIGGAAYKGQLLIALRRASVFYLAVP